MAQSAVRGPYIAARAGVRGAALYICVRARCGSSGTAAGHPSGAHPAQQRTHAEGPEP